MKNRADIMYQTHRAGAPVPSPASGNDEKLRRRGRWRSQLLSSLLVAVFITCSFAAEADSGAGFEFSSGIASYDQAYQKARRVIAADVQDGKFLAGQNWQQVWTRDTSYSVELACALLHPGVSKTTLLGLTQQVDGIGECWAQHTWRA